jgi:glutamate synthase (NADPH/NADH) small chain
MTRGPQWTVAPDRLETRLPDRKPVYSVWEATNEARRCLYCHDAPCIQACPTAIDIPSFIRKISTGNLRGSARTILQANLLGLSCARVCPVEVLCEGKCVYVDWGRPPVPIGRLQRYAMERGSSPELLAHGVLPPATPSGRSVGLVGAGPASVACAGRLALRGHTPVIYEKAAIPGGLNATGIAPYKLQAADALAEIADIEALGVEIRTGVEVGADVSAEQLLVEHDAVFLGPGLGADARLDVPGEDGPGVVGAVEWIRRLKTDPTLSLDGVSCAFVIGGGNTAVDVARELVGLGVDSVTLVYRRDRSRLRTYDHELAQGRQEGVVLALEAAVAEILRGAAGEEEIEDGADDEDAVLLLERDDAAGEIGDVVGLRMVATEDGEPTGDEIGIYPADLVVMAIGQASSAALAALFPDVECDADGCIVIDPETGVTGNPRVFAGGDAVNGGKEVVNAVHDGQVAADAMDALFRGDTRGGGDA